MARIHDTLDTAALAYGSTSASAPQDEAAFDRHLDERPQGQNDQDDAGNSDPIFLADVDRGDAVNQQPDLRLVVISNRVAPFDPSKPQTGGLAAALEPVVQRSGAIWIGSSEHRGDGSERPLPLVQTGAGEVARLDLPAKDYPGYYRGFSNSTLWPALHSLSGQMSGSDEDYEGYRNINDFIARAALGVRDRDAFWVHDYHLLPLGAALHDFGIERPTGFFLHTPWPAPEMIERVPHHRELMNSMLKYDLLGFQTNRDLENFVAGLRAVFGLESKDGVVTTERGQTRLQKFPIGIDPKQFAEYLAADLSPAEQEKVSSLLQKFEGTKFAIGVDRLDYTKGIDKRVEALNQHLKAEPHSISLLQIAPSSRADVEEYQKYKDSVENAINHVNNEHGTNEWRPIHYTNDSFSQAALARLYRAAKIGVVTPLRDGMNLVAKEYVAAQDPQDPGVLILSKFAGAAEDFSENEALLVDPNYPEEIAAAISKAANMPLDERVARWRPMMNKIESFTIHDWAADNVREINKSRITVPADQFHRVGLGWTNEFQLPQFERHVEALKAYNTIDSADVDKKERAHKEVEETREAFRATLEHTQDRLWDLPGKL
ncbi:putative Alpha,alpha-trehalose-phosphate synthase (ostA-like) [Bradyrhizobium sp. ORS 285]|uniref:alpha,alpha-trehalose-phosphate synthase (UDP-forming) n=1 Tax=Bradyrhizobium sp. ORS 285 TaxID=115808 RepID=UPI0002406D71|nr:trehalose-6-phosphate synthase [Bradyrhizobium sp. ORS 285]CCD87246.1 putative alpha,alpha-trehalose-phosphate synthase (UDP-forming) (Trehalose-6-phosphate synthase) (UDP-glucose-glucosephosphate glucosyltransferase) [Bradyrhizobium sp. ORS 285]SMX56341.1 putative Alpha,alpha-trehalose-phosphate synthase (ostA-like) [Bradyrhizobium sp. ORS 285]